MHRYLRSATVEVAHSAARGSIAALLVLSLVLMPSAAQADPVATAPAGLRGLNSAWPIASFGTVSATQQSPSSSSARRDSLKNGALIGAIVGAAALGGFGLFLCHALDDTGDPNCFPGVLGIAALGAGIGVGAGLVVDVLLTKHAGPTVRAGIRF
jgi:hypothetical protein